MKNLLSLFMSFFLVSFVAAQNTDGVILYQLGEYDLAKTYFEQNASSDPALDNYYLGQIATQKGDLVKAKQYYEKSFAVNSSLYGEIGLAALDLKSNPKEAKKILEGIAKKNKKDSAVCIQVAKAFYDNGMMEEGTKISDELMKAKDKNPNVFILRGDVAMNAGDTGAAAAEYEQAVSIDPTNIVGLIKFGLVYEKINPATALEQYRKALQVDPNNKLVMRFMAKVYTNTARYPQAIALYKEYFANNKYNLDDLSYYARALYFNGSYNEAKDILLEALKQEPNNFVFNRLLMYCDENLKENEAGIEVANKFFKLRSSLDSGYLAKDFISYGTMLINLGDIESAVLQFDKAAAMDPKNGDLYKELAAELNKSKLYLEAAKMMDSYIAIAGENTKAEDYVLQGRYYQQAAQALARDTENTDETQRIELLTNAEVAFGNAVAKNPESFLGYFSQAGVNALLDPQAKEPKAKELYEKALSIIEASGEIDSRKAVVSVIYEYLTIYYYLQYAESNSKEMKEQASKYCDLAIALNPDKKMINDIKAELVK